MRINVIVSICIAAIACSSFPGCLPIGECRYGKLPIEQGMVSIESVDKIREVNRELVKVSVKGLFSRSFYLTPEEYDKCIAGKGLTVGSKITGTVVPGGPCPPMYYLEECR